MKITDVSLTLFAWDDIPPTQYGQHSRFAGSSALGLLRIATDDGVEGHAFLGSASNSAAIDGQGLITHLKPMLMGRNPLHREALVVDLWKRQRPAGVRTIGAVDVALWDLLGKAVGQPIHRLLGTYRESVPAYASSAVLAAASAYAEQAVEFKENGWQPTRFIRRRAGARTSRSARPCATPSATTPSCSIRPGPKTIRPPCASVAPSRRWSSTGTKTRSPTRTSTTT